MADKDMSMYDTDETEIKQPFGRPSIMIKKTPLTTTIRIGNDEIQVINPQYVNDLQTKMAQMENRVKVLEDELRQLRANTRNSVAVIKDLRSQMDRKIDRD